MTDLKTTVDLPFSPEDVLNGRLGDLTEREKVAYDRTWEIIRHNPYLSSFKRRVSIHEIRLVIAAVGAAFAMDQR